MEVELTDDDIQLMLTEIGHFCQRSIQPLVERPENLIQAEQLTQLTEQAAEIGLINLGVDPGAGLWEDLQCEGWGRFSSNALRCVGRMNAGIAFHFHQLALGRYVCQSLQIEGDLQSIVCLQGAYGLARFSLARLLKGDKLSDLDQRLLRDYFVTLGAGKNFPLLFQADTGWQRLLVPCWDDRQQFGWAVYDREDLQVVSLAHSHGLNESLTWQWQAGDQPPQQWIAGEKEGLALYGSAFNANAQALIAIALGTLQLGYERAAEYAAQRKQGGQPINQHAAVRQMLGVCASTIRTVDLLREQLSCLAVSADNLGTVLAVRAQAHDLLCAAANDALQTLGGSGYMTEVGLEKTVRDCNHLRLICGTPGELLMFVSEWENGG